MLNHISRIGIFMIAAQAVVHFAPGRQYEKYIKSVAGIIILVLFLKPFLQFFGAQPEAPQDILERFEKMMEVPDMAAVAKGGVDVKMVRQMEEEVQDRLNCEMEGEDYCVGSVSIRLAEKKGQELFLSAVEVRLVKRGEESGGKRIGVDEIVVGKEQELSSRELFETYRERFARLLGIEKESVEVR